jgi:hypothetical protein
VAACLPSLAFESNLDHATIRAKAALVRAYYAARHWSTAGDGGKLPPMAAAGDQFVFDELISSATATVQAASLLGTSDKLRYGPVNAFNNKIGIVYKILATAANLKNLRKKIWINWLEELQRVKRNNLAQYLLRYHTAVLSLDN